MKVVVVDMNDAVLAERRRKGLDRLDEKWEGVLHMAPAPTNRHQLLASRIAAFISERVRGHAGLVQCNVSTPARWDSDYRIPDVAAVTEPVADAAYCQPVAVFEIRSPGDESYDKLPFYAAVRVASVVIVDRDTRSVDAFALGPEGYARLTADSAGWVRVASLGLELRTDVTGPRLELRLTGDAAPPQSI